MSKPRLSRKRVLIFVIVVAILLVGIGGFYYWRHYQPLSESTAPPPSAAAQLEAKQLSLAGNQTLMAQYVDQINVKNTAAAQKLFDAAVAQTSDKDAKQVLLSQNVTVALSYGQVDTAEQVALAAIKNNPSYATYNDAYRVYVAKYDYVKQQEMLQKAIAAAKTEDLTDKEQLINALESQLQTVQQQIIAEQKRTNNR